MMSHDPERILASARSDRTFFDGFEEHIVSVPDGEVFVRVKGDGPPLLLIHGYPQTSAMWHRVAPKLAENYRVYCADLRGYGRSSKPPSDPDHATYSKRAMAGDLVAMMESFGHSRFLVGSHDRGARVGHRMAADYPQKVQALAILDIAPTREMYREGDSAFAATYWHWYWLIQPAPMPERQISSDPDYYWCYKCCDATDDAGFFSRQALEEYMSAFRDPDTIRGSCEDYRAAYSIDIMHDNAETARITTPLHVLWGANGAIEAHFDCLALWRERANDVEGEALPGGHYLAEELPDQVLNHWIAFFEVHAHR